MFSAQQINMITLGLVAYIIVYVIFLAYVVLNSSKDPKIVRQYIKHRDDVGTKKLVPIAVVGGVLLTALMILYCTLI